MQSKISSYIGFAVKSGAAVFGADAIERCKKRVCLVIFSSDISERSKRNALALAEKNSAAVMIAEEGGVEAAAHKQNCKLIALTDKNLSEAAIKALENDREFKLYSREEN